MKYKYTEQQFRDAVENSLSIRQTLVKLSIAPKGGSYKTFSKAIDKYCISTSHFTGQAHSKGKRLKEKVPLELYLTNIRPINSFRLKRKLLDNKILSPMCFSCKQTKWLDTVIPLELDHIDGDSYNNLLTNLRLLCPNCHALTPTYRGKNKKPRH